MTKTFNREDYCVLLQCHGARLAIEHLARYRRRLVLGQQGNKAVNVDECEALIKLWLEVTSEDFQFEDLSPEAKFEVMDAIDDDTQINAPAPEEAV